jgi:undecaprenyl-diphosphatase
MANIYIFNIINGLAGKSMLLDQIMIFSAKYVVSIIPIIIIALWLEKTNENKKAAVFITFSVLIALLLGYITKNIYYHPRPFAIGIGLDLVPDDLTSSFPSDHTTGMFALSFALLFIKKYRLAIVSFPLALLVGFSRIFIGVHFPFDILGSIAYGTIGALIAILLKQHLDSVTDKIIELQKGLAHKSKAS